MSCGRIVFKMSDFVLLTSAIVRTFVLVVLANLKVLCINCPVIMCGLR
jgi:hypothetical protein